MANDGSELEKFVSTVENALKPHFDVVCNQKVYDDGICVAELDIQITGKGGAPRYLLECRDCAMKRSGRRGCLLRNC